MVAELDGEKGAAAAIDDAFAIARERLGAIADRRRTTARQSRMPA